MPLKINIPPVEFNNLIPIEEVPEDTVSHLESPPAVPIKNQTKYNKNFAEKNKDKISQRKMCEVCYGNYTYYNKSRHNKTKRHITAMNAKNALQA